MGNRKRTQQTNFMRGRAGLLDEAASTDDGLRRQQDGDLGDEAPPEGT